MDSPLVPIFLAVIALAAILQAAVVAGLAYAMRIVGRKVAEVEETVAAQVEAQAAALSSLTETAVRASRQTLAQAERLEGVVTEATDKVHAVMGAVTSRIESAAEGAAYAAEDFEEDEEPARGKIAHAAALFRGVQRAVEVWRDTAPAEDGGRRRSSPP